METFVPTSMSALPKMQIRTTADPTLIVRIQYRWWLLLHLCRCFYSTNDGNSVCADIDECVEGTHNCNVDATCTNTDGGFECGRKAGFAGESYDAGSEIDCADVNECANVMSHHVTQMRNPLIILVHTLVPVATITLVMATLVLISTNVTRPYRMETESVVILT